MFEHAASVRMSAECVRSVVDDLQIVVVGDLLDSVDIARMSVAVHRENRGWRRRDCRFDLRRVQVERVRVDINEDRLDTVPKQRVRGRNKRIRGGNDFARDTQRLQGGYQRERAIRKQRKVLYPKVVTQGFFGLVMKRAAVGQ